MKRKGISNSYDVIIIGAGPAGSAAAIKIASQKHRVLLVDKFAFPRAKSCGGGLTRLSLTHLYDLGLKEELSTFNKVTEVQLSIKGKGTQTFTYPDFMEDPNYNTVVTRKELDTMLVKKAIDNNAEFMSGVAFKTLIFKGEKAIGVTLENGEQYFAHLIIAADGAHSKIAQQLGFYPKSKKAIGVGQNIICKVTNHGITSMTFFLPILDSSNKRVLPSYGWVFPVNQNVLNIGVGLSENSDAYDIESIMSLFLERLKDDYPFLSKVALNNTPQKGLMRFDFTPKKCYAPGVILVGDATGMINPFTGEGIGYALESGILAAQLFTNLKSQTDQTFEDLSEYGKLLATKYQGYFEAGQTSINRHHLVWKVLKGTFNNHKPLFNAIRQATVFPEGINDTFFKYHTEDVSQKIPGNNGQMRTDILTISKNLIDLTRQDWPFLSRMFTANQVTHGIPFRPSLFTLIAGYGPNTNRNELVQLGTAIELGFAASLCHDSVSEKDHDDSDSNFNWGNMMSILIGDYLLSKSFEIVAPFDYTYTSIISEAVGKSNEGTILLKQIITEHKEMTSKEFIALYQLKNCYAFELCLHLGGLSKKTAKQEILALRDFGKYYGVAYFLTEDLIAFSQQQKSKHTIHTRSLELELLNMILKKGSSDNQLAILIDTINDNMEKARLELLKISDPWLKSCLDNFCNLIQEKLQLVKAKKVL